MVGALVENIARRRWITSEARLASRIVRRAVSAAPARFGGSAASIRTQVLALVRIPDRGWLTSWAMEAVMALRVATRATWASSLRARFSASSATLLSVMSWIAPMKMGLPSMCSMTWETPRRYFKPPLGVTTRKLKSPPAPSSRALHLGIEDLQVIRMNPSTDRIQPWRRRAIDFEDAVELVRPMVPILLNVRGEAAGLAEELRLRELCQGFAQFPFARVEGRIGLGPVDGDTSYFCEPVDEAFFLGGWGYGSGPIDRHDAGNLA